MKNFFIILLFCFFTSHVQAFSPCPNGEQYIEKMNYHLSADALKQKKFLAHHKRKMVAELSKKYPDTNILCDIYEGKYFYCVACPQ